ncbi:MAG: hypothetical protein ACJA2O_000796 [Candidatus Azotimanducaceae bacterium]|jgi:hypothetical protein
MSDMPFIMRIRWFSEKSSLWKFIGIRSTVHPWQLTHQNRHSQLFIQRQTSLKAAISQYYSGYTFILMLVNMHEYLIF